MNKELEQTVNSTQASTNNVSKQEEISTEKDFYKIVEESETDIDDRIFFITIISCIVGVALFIWGMNDHKNELLITSGIIVFVFSLLWFWLIKPLINILIGISRNLRELNQKTKQQ